MKGINLSVPQGTLTASAMFNILQYICRMEVVAVCFILGSLHAYCWKRAVIPSESVLRFGLESLSTKDGAIRFASFFVVVSGASEVGLCQSNVKSVQCGHVELNAHQS